MIGCVLLIFDLGRWYRFYKLFLHLRVVSPMSIGTWLLMLFTLAFVTAGVAGLFGALMTKAAPIH